MNDLTGSQTDTQRYRMRESKKLSLLLNETLIIKVSLSVFKTTTTTTIKEMTNNKNNLQ